MQLDDRALLAEWKPSYHRGALMQATLALVSGILGLAAWWLSGDWRWIVGAVLILAPWPYTLIVHQADQRRAEGHSASKRPTPRRAHWWKNGDACTPCARRSGSRRRIAYLWALN